MWSVVTWGELTWLMWSDFILKRSEVSYGEFLVDTRAMYIMVTLYWGNLITLWLFHLGISCTVFVLICTLVVLNCFVMCVCVGGGGCQPNFCWQIYQIICRQFFLSVFGLVISAGSCRPLMSSHMCCCIHRACFTPLPWNFLCEISKEKKVLEAVRAASPRCLSPLSRVRKARHVSRFK
jgi:hypothetical protein